MIVDLWNSMFIFHVLCRRCARKNRKGTFGFRNSLSISCCTLVMVDIHNFFAFSAGDLALGHSKDDVDISVLLWKR